MLVVVGSIASGVGAAPIGWDPVYGFASTSSCLLEEPDLNILVFFFFWSWFFYGFDQKFQPGLSNLRSVKLVLSRNREKNVAL